MTDGPDYYVNEPPGEMKAHIFHGEDIHAAGLTDGETDEPVSSLCSMVRAYGPFVEWGDGAVCQNCVNNVEGSEL